MGQGLIAIIVNPRVLATASNVTSFSHLFWIWKDLIESKLFTPVDCFPVHRFDQIEKLLVKVSFAKEIWSIGGEKKTCRGASEINGRRRSLGVVARAEMSTTSMPLETTMGKSSKVPFPTKSAYRIWGRGSRFHRTRELPPTPPPQ
jgi:hypothetical protein